MVQPDGAKTECKYNYMGLLYKVTDDCGTVYTASYDKAGRLVKEKSRADSEKSYKYDNGGRITEVLCGGEVVESYNYAADSRTVTVKDGKGEDYVYNYDVYGRFTDEVNRKGLLQSYIYDEDGQLKGQTNFDGSTTAIVYSENRTVRTVKYSDGSENRFVYDSLGNITEAQNAYGKTIYSYDKGGRLIYQKDVTTGEEIHFYYDDAGNRTKLLSSNRETIYTYGKNSEVKEIFDNNQRLSVKLEYDKNGREVLRKFGNGTLETTLYDKAGRVTVKAQKSERGEILWAEGYLYGSDGKRTATVNNKGAVTLYEYNKKGQLETVYYPYSQEMINLLKSEAEENGLPVNTELGENRFLPSDIKSGLTSLMNLMQYTLAYNLTNLQLFIKENYSYDKNGNRITKTTNYGTINYCYDKENCLVSSGSRGQSFVNYTYDNMGNLLTEESQLTAKKYAYNAQNRLIYCEVTDKSNREYAQTTYAYDAFGRRILVQDKGEAALRTLYDGLTFDVIKQSPTFENGLFTDSQNTGIQWERTGKPTGERYRYISDENAKDDARYVYLDENAYRIKNSRYTGERTQISVNGTIAAQTTNEGAQYFTTDLFGSVSTVSDSLGYQLGSYAYDAFGSLIKGDLSGSTDFGYLGKQNDPISRLYNYGYRDYKPQTARFTTIDPIRDGSNWFAYVNNDPVNFVDLWGLCQGSDGSWIKRTVNGIDEYYYDPAIQFQSQLDQVHTIKRQGQTITWKTSSGQVLPNGYQLDGYTFYQNGTITNSNGSIINQIEPIQTDNYDIFVSRSSDAVDPKTLHNNFFGTSYTGYKNPKTYPNKNGQRQASYDYEPHNPSEYGSKKHDLAYSEKNTAGITGALFNTDVISADFDLVSFNLKNLFNEETPFDDKVRSALTATGFTIIGVGKSLLWSLKPENQPDYDLSQEERLNAHR